MASIKSAIRLFFFIVLTLLLLPLQIFMHICFRNSAGAFIVPQLWHRNVCRLYGIKIKVQGVPQQDGSVLFVGNHVSYLDIPVITSITPVRFIAKKEVKSWPLFGLLATIQQTFFIDRSRMAAAQEKEKLAKTIARGGRFLLFPEGTSSNGTQVLPFKPAAFAMLCDDELTQKPAIQPFSIKIAAVNGAPPTSQDEYDIYAWHGDMDLAPHLWTLGKQREVIIEVIFHESFTLPATPERKALALQCQRIVAAPYNNKNFKVAA